MTTLPLLDDLCRGIMGGIAARAAYGYVLIAACATLYAVLAFAALRWFGVVGPQRRRPNQRRPRPA